MCWTWIFLFAVESLQILSVWAVEYLPRFELQTEYMWVWSCSSEPMGEAARAYAALPLAAEDGVHQELEKHHITMKADYR